MNFENAMQVEQIVGSALQFRGEIFKGTSHARALDELELVYPDWNKDKERVIDGFMTNTGRFVLRDEAERISNKTE